MGVATIEELQRETSLQVPTTAGKKDWTRWRDCLVGFAGWDPRVEAWDEGRHRVDLLPVVLAVEPAEMLMLAG